MSYLLICNTPGYLPDDMGDQPEFEEYTDATAAMNELADDLEENGYEIFWGCCHRNWLAFTATRETEQMSCSIDINEE